MSFANPINYSDFYYFSFEFADSIDNYFSYYFGGSLFYIAPQTIMDSNFEFELFSNAGTLCDDSEESKCC